MSVPADIKPISQAFYAGMSMINPHTKLHMPTSTTSLATAIEPKTRENFSAAITYLFYGL
jgi:hypothetical protein